MRPETKVETLLGRMASDRGGMSLKMVPLIAGLPDRLVLLPGGRSYFIELKAPRGRLRFVQRVRHEQLEKIGHPVIVLSSQEAVREWFNNIDSGVPD